jgi:transposase
MPQKRYTDEFKIAAVKLVHEQGYSPRKAGLSLGVDPCSIRAWARNQAPAAEAQVQLSDASPEQLRTENRRLREENRRLLMEREILKKAAAFFAKEQL